MLDPVIEYPIHGNIMGSVMESSLEVAAQIPAWIRGLGSH